MSISSHDRSSISRYAGRSWLTRSGVRENGAPGSTGRRWDPLAESGSCGDRCGAGTHPVAQPTNKHAELEQACRSSGNVSRYHRFLCRGNVGPPSTAKPKRTTWGHGASPSNSHGSPGFQRVDQEANASTAFPRRSGVGLIWRFVQVGGNIRLASVDKVLVCNARTLTETTCLVRPTCSICGYRVLLD